jgi:hypothetical protein
MTILRGQLATLKKIAPRSWTDTVFAEADQNEVIVHWSRFQVREERSTLGLGIPLRNPLPVGCFDNLVRYPG